MTKTIDEMYEANEKEYDAFLDKFEKLCEKYACNDFDARVLKRETARIIEAWAEP